MNYLVSGDLTEEVDYERQPRATYTQPEVASIGLTEQQCEYRGITFMKGSFPFAADGKAVMVGETDSFAKVITDAATNATLRVHLIGLSVSGLMAESAVDITLWATARQIGATTYSDPTLSKVLRQAAMAVDGQQSDA